MPKPTGQELYAHEKRVNKYNSLLQEGLTPQEALTRLGLTQNNLYHSIRYVRRAKAMQARAQEREQRGNA